MDNEQYKFLYTVVFGIFIGAAIELILGVVFDFYYVFAGILILMVALQVHTLGSGRWKLE